MEDNRNTQTKDDNKGVVLDPNKLASAPRGIKNKLNADDDAWAISAPPQHDIYCLKPVLAKQGLRLFDKGMVDSYKRVVEIPFYTINVEHRIIAESDPDVHMWPTFQNLSTKLGRGKHISTAAGFIKKMGFAVPQEADDLEIVTMLVEILKKEKVLFGEVDWRASFNDPDPKVGWQNVCNSASDFPKDPATGERLHRIRVTNSKGTPVEVPAQIQVTKLYSRKEYKELSESGELEKIRASFGIGQITVNTSQLAEEDETVVVTKTNGVVKPKPVQMAEPEPVVSQAKLAMALVEDE